MKKWKVLKRNYMPTYAPITWLFVIYLLFDNLQDKLNPLWLGALMTLLLLVHSLQWIRFFVYLFNSEAPNISELE